MLNNINTLIINLPERVDRLEKSNAELEKFGILNYTVVEAVKEEPTMKAIAKSHLKAISIAKENKWPYVLILEDDIYFQSERSREYADICFNNIPSDWDMLLGGVYTSAGLQPYNNCWSKTKEFSGLHFYIVNERCYDYILNTYDFNSHIDRWMARDLQDRYNTCGRLKCYVATPFFAIQYDGYSDNVKRETEYSQLLKKFNVLK